MSDFSRWSRWFECGLELKREKTHAMAVMGWIAAHAASDGSDEIGLSPEEAWAAVDVLIAEGLVTAVGQQTARRLVVRAVI
jgi:hypothetical protein